MQLYAGLKLGRLVSSDPDSLWPKAEYNFLLREFLRNHVHHRTNLAQRSFLYHEDPLNNNPSNSRYWYYDSTTLLYACSDSVYNSV